MIYGLLVSDQTHSDALRTRAASLLASQEIPFSGFTDAPSPLFDDVDSRQAFLFRAAFALMQPGQPIPADLLIRHLSGDAQPGNVLRHYAFLQLSLLPYLRPGFTVTSVDGGVMLGSSLLILRPSDDGTEDVRLPDGIWTMLHSGECCTGTFRRMHGYQELPVLVRKNTLLPIGVNDRTADADDADRLVLHWFQPDKSAVCILADSTRYCAFLEAGAFCCESTSRKPYHCIVHQNGEEIIVR